MPSHAPWPMLPTAAVSVSSKTIRLGIGAVALELVGDVLDKAGVVDRRARQVELEGQIGVPGGQRKGMVDHPAVDQVDQPEPLGCRQELARRDDAVAVAEPQQHFAVGHLPVLRSTIGCT